MKCCCGYHGPLSLMALLSWIIPFCCCRSCERDIMQMRSGNLSLCFRLVGRCSISRAKVVAGETTQTYPIVNRGMYEVSPQSPFFTLNAPRTIHSASPRRPPPQNSEEKLSTFCPSCLCVTVRYFIFHLSSPERRTTLLPCCCVSFQPQEED